MDIRDLDWNLLPVLDALLRLRSVTLAARELDMSQSAVSSALARLRLALDDALLVRTGRGLLPTPRAADLAGVVASILGDVRERVLSPPLFDPAKGGRSFTVCLSDVGSYVLWPRIVRRMRAWTPSLRLQMKVLPGADIAAALEAGHIQVAIGTLPQLPDFLLQRRLFERRYVGLVRKGHPLQSQKMDLKTFARTAQVVVRLPSGVQELIDRQLELKKLQRSDVLEVPSYLMTPPLIASDDYLAVLPSELADVFVINGAFAQVELPLKVPSSVIRLHWHRRYHDDPGNLWLREQLITLLAD